MYSHPLIRLISESSEAGIKDTDYRHLTYEVI